jgi:hypothetical protein
VLGIVSWNAKCKSIARVDFGWRRTTFQFRGQCFSDAGQLSRTHMFVVWGEQHPHVEALRGYESLVIVLRHRKKYANLSLWWICRWRRSITENSYACSEVTDHVLGYRYHTFWFKFPAIFCWIICYGWWFWLLLTTLQKQYIEEKLCLNWLSTWLISINWTGELGLTSAEWHRCRHC